jgi:hypothetical protein
MSQRQVLTVLDALLQDAEQGLGITVDRLSSAMGAGATLRSDFNFGTWALPGIAQPTTRGNVVLRPIAWRPMPLYADRIRDAECDIEISFETFAAEPNDITNEVLLVSLALTKVLDQLREYSDKMVASYGTVIDLTGDPPRYAFSYGEFAGPTSNGFVCRFSLNERSTSD